MAGRWWVVMSERWVVVSDRCWVVGEVDGWWVVQKSIKRSGPKRAEADGS